MFRKRIRVGFGALVLTVLLTANRATTGENDNPGVSRCRKRSAARATRNGQRLGGSGRCPPRRTRIRLSITRASSVSRGRRDRSGSWPGTLAGN